MSRPTERIPCPDCGGQFLPRGLASHRRQKHGVAAPAAVGEVDLGPVLEALGRIEARLERLEVWGRAEDGGDDDLRLRLEEVLAQIRAVNAERAALEGEWAEQQRQACDLELLRLRRQQTDLLVGLDELTFH
ncbi:MAG: hypothetical protein O2816_12630 [Planctomycetota bacterium]|nr:hypothetical protein [Planctomycetota bacterium]